MIAWKRSAKPASWYPRRGDVCLAALDKERPVVILSRNALNARSLDVCVLPISSVEHGEFTLRPGLKAGEGGLKRDSWVKCDQPITIEKQLIVYPPLGSLSRESLTRIETGVKEALDLS